MPADAHTNNSSLCMDDQDSIREWLNYVTDRFLAAESGRRNSSRRRRNRGGRPKAKLHCSTCELKMGARELRRHRAGMQEGPVAPMRVNQPLGGLRCEKNYTTPSLGIVFSGMCSSRGRKHTAGTDSLNCRHAFRRPALSFYHGQGEYCR